MIQFLIGLGLFSQLVAGAKDCNSRRDCEAVPEGSNQIAFVGYRSLVE